MKIGIYGGSFDPIHNAHLKMAEAFVASCSLDKCVFIPTATSPFKIGEKQTNARNRYEMTALAIEKYPKFDISDFEISNPDEVSYTYKTLNYLNNLYAEDNLYLLIGGDNAAAFKKWKNWQDILNMAQLCIVDRPGTLDAKQKEEIKKALSNKSKEPHWVSAPLMEISSTIIRAKVSKGFSIKDLLPKKVENYIRQNRLYL